MVCAVTAWAETTVSLSDGTLTIKTTDANTLSSNTDLTILENKASISTIILEGKFSSADLNAIGSSNGFTGVKTVDFSLAKFPITITSTNYMVFSIDPARESYSGNINDNTLSVVGSLYKSASKGYLYYHREQENNEWHWVSIPSLPVGTDAAEPDSWAVEGIINDQNASWYNAYEYVKVPNPELEWQLQENVAEGATYDLGDRIYATPESMVAPASADLYAVVGGSEKIYNGGAWVDVAEACDWTQMAFGGWNGLETIILPDNFNVESGKNYNNFYGNNKSTLQRIERGDSYAIIGSSNNNYSAEIFCADDDRANMKAIVGLDNFITQDANITYANPNDHDYITWNEITQVYDVHVTSAGSLKSKYTKLLNTVGQNALEDKVFRFDSECTGFTAEDLQALAHANGPFVYVDLYNVAATEAVETAISDALKGNDSGVSALANNQHYKGLLLPSDPQQIGTALIANTGSSSPVSEFIAYKSGTTTVAHIYDTSASDESKYEPKVTALKGIMDAHSDIASGSSVYLVSTNCKTPIGNVATIKGTSTTASIVHTYNNEMVNPDETNPTKPSIEVIPAAAGGYATLNEATNMRNTPNTETLKFKGNINADDILAVNSFTQTHWDNTTNSYVENNPKVYNGPRVLDLSEVPASQITQSLLNNLENPEIQYIILPAGMDAPVVGDYAKLTNLKCVISSDNSSTEGDKVLNAYVKVAGSLAEARCIATGNNDNGNSTFKPTAQGLTTVKLSGNLNANDIATGSDSGGLNGEQGTITSLDLEGAYFANSNDMRLGSEGGAGLTALTEVKLPTDSRMTEIPEGCLYNLSSLHNLHIPYNYEKIGWEAFWETGINHITTEDASHSLIDNGPNTYTLSANLKELGKPNQGEGHAVFPGGQVVTDVYCLAMEVPTCYAHTFHANMVYANGGMYGGVYCREKYMSDANAIALLHFPSQESWTNAKGDKETNYSDLVAKYTDPTRTYSKKDQTGAVDANGKPLTWPDQGELLGARTMAEAGYVWEDYKEKQYQEEGDGHLISLGSAEGGTKAFYPNYVGWHEFVLSNATYVEPDEIIENKKIVREYEEAGWYTFCIPFNMTNEQVVRMLGVPAGDGENVVCKVYNSKGELINGDVRSDMMPEIRQLSSVTRKKGENGKNNIVMLRMTPDLVDANHAGYTAYLEITYPGGIEKHRTIDAEEYNSTSNFDERLSLIGGRPYIIKAYKRKQIVNNVDLYKIKGQNLGKYVLEHYADEFGVESSIVQNTKYPEFLEYEQLKNGKGEALTTLRFAKPFENHRIQAVRDGDNSAYLTYETTEGGETVVKKYYYTMIGQFWQQPLPKYCLYMSKGNWYRYSNVPEKIEDRYTWDPYKCVIMATEEVSGTKGAGYRDETKSVYPVVQEGTDDKLNDTFSLTFLDGRDDDDFGANGTSSRYIFGLDDDIIEFDEEGNEVTAIERLDGEDIVPAGSKVYNVAGQYVGESLNGLTKGLYIVNGKKIVVK